MVNKINRSNGITDSERYLQTLCEKSFLRLLTDADAFSAQMRLLWFSAGSAETWFHQGLQHIHQSLAQMKIPHEIFISENTAHEWQTWRRSFHAFAPRLFRTQK